MMLTFFKTLTNTILFLAILVTFVSLVFSYKKINLHLQHQLAIEDFANSSNNKISTAINNYLTRFELVSQELNYSLQKSILDKDHIWKIIEKKVQVSKGGLGMGASYQPYTLGGQLRLFSPYIYRSYNGYKRVNNDHFYDYSLQLNSPVQQPHWYVEALKKNAHWLSPTFDHVSQQLVIQHNIPLSFEQKRIGISYINVAMAELVKSVEHYYLGNGGYFLLLDKNRKLLYHSLHPESLVTLDKQLTQVNFTEQAQWSGKVALNNQDVWLNSQKLRNTDWYLMTVVDSQLVLPSLTTKDNFDNLWGYIDKTTIFTGLIIFNILLWMIFILMVKINLSANYLWLSSLLISSVFLSGTLFIWSYFYNTYMKDPVVEKSITTQASIKKIVNEYSLQSLQEHKAPPIFIPTSLFIQSIEFNTAYNINITGYIWQKYPLDLDINYGVVFPESETIDFTESYRYEENGYLTIGWYFEGVFREKFNYLHYPFDRQLVWIRIWHANFERNVILTPMVESYENINPNSLAGLEKEFVINGWTIEKTFFDFRTNSYNTNFGMPRHYSKDNRPELYFNISLRRNFIDPFISYLFPVMVVLLMLFGVLITTWSKDASIEDLQFSVSTVLSSCSALFFVSLISHAQLRSHIATNQMIYLEYFFLACYVMILLVVLNAILLSLQLKWQMLTYKENILPKVCFWPLLLGVYFFITLIIYSE